jgi:RsiW-degrading membrane proteinase PrsW (M82 family)
MPRIVTFAVLCLVFLCGLCGLCGCSARLLGTNDVELAYTISGDDEALENRVRSRLAAASLSADVERPAKDQLLLRIDAERATLADALVRWRGGVALFHPIEAVPGKKPPEYRGPPRLDLTTELVRVDKVHEGHDLMLTFKSPLPREPVAVVRGETPLGVGTPDGSSITISLGDDIYSYTRADHERKLLSSPLLPALKKTDSRPVAPRWPIAVACLVLPFVVSLGWLSFVRRFDRAHPEPLWLVVLTFLLGGLSVVIAGLLEFGFMRLNPHLNPTLMTYGGQIGAFPVALAVFTVVVGLSEEGAKFLGAWVVIRRRPEFDEPIDGIVYGVAASLGFAAVENIGYFAMGRLAGTVVVLRSFTSVPAHMFFGAVWGYALGRKLVAPRTSVLFFLFVSAALHGAFDTLLSTHGLEVFGLGLNLLLASLFVLLLRRALRRGVITSPSAAPESSRRVSFSLGSSSAFAVSVVFFHIFALAIVAHGIHFEAQGRRIDYPFLVGSAVLLILFGVAARGVVATLPLEAVVDEHGITFGGKSLPWDAIRGFELRGREILVVSPGETLRLGPGKPATLDTLFAMLATYATSATSPRRAPHRT